MLEKLIKNDRNEKLETVLEQKHIEEQVKNLLQGILYKIEVSYKDYQKAKVTSRTEKQYVNEIISDIQKKCQEIKTVKFQNDIEDPEIKHKLEKNKYYIDDKLVLAYPIEEKLLYAVEKKSNSDKIVNDKYEMLTMPLSNIINTGKSLDRVEVLRDFNGWSWTTIKKEIENIKANLVYQTLRILEGEDFVESWTKDKDGIIDYVQMLKENIKNEYGEEISNSIEECLTKISIMNGIEISAEYRKDIENKLKESEEKLQKFKDTNKFINEITQNKKVATDEIAKIEKILSQEKRIKEEYEKRNSTASLDKKIFSIRVLRQQLKEQKMQYINEIEESNYLLIPENFLKEKNKVQKQKELFEILNYTEEEKEKVLIEFEKIFLECFKKKIDKVKPEELDKIIYIYRYYLLLPFNIQENIKDVNELQDNIIEVEKKIVKLAKEKKVISNEVPFEVMTHVFQTRIIKLEELYYKIITENDKNYVQIFDENITEDKFEISNIEKKKINKKIRIFIY